MPHDAAILTGATVNFLIFTASLALGISGFAGAFDLFSKVKELKQESRYLRSIFMIAMFVIFSSMIPLIISERQDVIALSSVIIFIPALAIYLNIIHEIINDKVKVQNPKIFYVLYTLSGCCLVSIPSNYILNSAIFYKALIFWASFVLYYRFYLFLSHLVKIKT